MNMKYNNLWNIESIILFYVSSFGSIVDTVESNIVCLLFCFNLLDREKWKDNHSCFFFRQCLIYLLNHATFC